MEAARLVEKRLGRRAAELYARVLEMLEAATPGDTPTRRALRLIVINLLCGAYHDYRSEGNLPKGDLVLSLRDLPDDRAIRQLLVDLESDVLRGAFDEEESEGERWTAHLLATSTRQRGVARPLLGARPDVEVVELTPREREVFEWLHRYAEVYKRPPTIREIANGCAMHASRARQILGQLEAKRVVQNLGGARGWMPLRSP